MNGYRPLTGRDGGAGHVGTSTHDTADTAADA
jgi:hypothetical protein